MGGIAAYILWSEDFCSSFPQVTPIAADTSLDTLPKTGDKGVGSTSMLATTALVLGVAALLVARRRRQAA